MHTVHDATSEPTVPAWLESTFPWLVSFLLHSGLFMLALFATYWTIKAAG